ncbi:protein maternal effect lethal 26-like [Trichogramma pretiosum]|uniref:protein maternal effect lethal 26-like n=1 Tax=Trichogramma pretiosum TaxID=7493 RepID=UPI0006C956DD|nr:protein maternal effect lethal 26-like [Trichogramma pretiosum]
MSSVNTIIGFTELETKKADFTWVLRQFKRIWDGRQTKGIPSPTFTFGSDDQRIFYLYLWKNINRTQVDLFGIKKQSDFELTWKSSVNKDDKTVCTNSGILRSYHGDIYDSKPDHLACIVTIPNEEMINYISSTDTVSVRCKLTMTMVNSTKSLSHISIDTNEALVPNFNLDWMFLNENLSDIKLRVSGKEIPAHKIVLANASPIFKAMFSPENKSQSIDMFCITYEAAVEMLRYIYKGSVKIIDFTLAAQLLMAADKYQLEGLKKECEKMSNCYKYNMESLKKEAV